MVQGDIFSFSLSLSLLLPLHHLDNLKKLKEICHESVATYVFGFGDFLDVLQAPYYEEELVPLLKQQKVLYFTHADSRLANNDLPDSIQQLRCRANYHALKFVGPIRTLGQTLVERIQQDAPYIALHLR